MRPTAAALLLFLGGPTGALAAAPEADYIAARDAAISRIAKMEARNATANASALNRQALAGLERRLRAIVGGLSVQPYPATGEIAIDTLSTNEVGAGGLDALRFATEDAAQQVHVTTEGLLARWLSKPADWWTRTRKTPPPAEAALADPDFYSRAIGVDAALTKMAELPVVKPAGAEFVFALLGGWAQEAGPNPDQRIIVALRRGGKVYIAQEKARAYRPIAACEAVWREAERKAADAASGDMLMARAERDFRACYAERLQKAEFFPALTKEAQGIADRFRGP